MKMSPAIQDLIDALRHLPGVGPKSAQRMTLHLLERDREAAESLGEALLAHSRGSNNASDAGTLPSSPFVRSAVIPSGTTHCSVSLRHRPMFWRLSTREVTEGFISF
jgi:hypothetical protein